MSEFAINAIVFAIFLALALVVFSIVRTMFMAVTSLILCACIWIAFNSLMPQEAQRVKDGLARVFGDVQEQTSELPLGSEMLNLSIDDLEKSASAVRENIEAVSGAAKVINEVASGPVEATDADSKPKNQISVSTSESDGEP